MAYQHLLVAVDTRAQRTALIAKAQALATVFGARLSVLSVLPPMPIEAYPADMGLAPIVPMSADPNWYDSVQDEARTSLNILCNPMGIVASDIHLVIGPAVTNILQSAQQLGADLIVVGHRQHPGISGWFSHTDENVVGKAVCDVLTVVLEAPVAN